MPHLPGPPVTVACAAGGEAWEAALLRLCEQRPHELTMSRRCLDLAEVMAAAEAGLAQVAVLSPAVRRLDRESVARLASCGTRVIGVSSLPDDDAWWAALGVRHVLRAQSLDSGLDVLLRGPGGSRSDLAAPADEAIHRTPAEAWPDADNDRAVAGSPGRPLGRVVVVWGPAGAPGRTTVAVTLAAALAAAGRRTLLVDADTYGGAVAPYLGLTESLPGISAACLAANRGRLGDGDLPAFCRRVTDTLAVLTGIPRPARWPEVPAESLRVVLGAGRSLAEVIVVDVGASLEADDEIVYDTHAPQRNAAARTALALADEVVAVGSADPIGIPRLVAGLADLHGVLEAAHDGGADAAAAGPTGPGSAVQRARVHVLANRVRAGVLGPQPERQVSRLLADIADVTSVHIVPEDRVGTDRALRQGRSLLEVAPRSSATRAITALAAQLDPTPVEGESRGYRSRRQQPWFLPGRRQARVG